LAIYAKSHLRQRHLKAVLEGEYGRKKINVPKKTGDGKDHYYRILAPKGKQRQWARFLSDDEWKGISELFRYPTLRLVIQELKNLIGDLGGWEKSEETQLSSWSNSTLWDKANRSLLFDLKYYYNKAKAERDEIKKEKRIDSTSAPIHQLAKITNTDRKVICRIRKFLLLAFIGSGEFLTIGDKDFWNAVKRGKQIRSSALQNRPRMDKEKNPNSTTPKSVTCSSTLERKAAMPLKKVLLDVPLIRHEDGLESIESEDFLDRLDRAIMLDAKLQTVGSIKMSALPAHLDFAFTLPDQEFNDLTIKEVAEDFNFSMEKTDLRAFLCATNMRPRKKKAIRSFPAPASLEENFRYARTSVDESDFLPYYDNSEYWRSRNIFRSVRKQEQKMVEKKEPTREEREKSTIGRLILAIDGFSSGRV